ncbi:hypothetical protein ABK040_003690 [Willaertia magna]
MVWKVLLGLGLLVLIHSLVSAAQVVHSSSGEHIPIDILIECLIGAILSSFAFVKHVTSSGSDGWKNIDLKTNVSSISMDAINSRLNFIHFNHRAKFLYNAQQ